MGDFIEVAELLVQNGAEVNVQGNWTVPWGGGTPLIWTTVRDSYRVAKLLISHDANKFQAKNDGTQAIHLAASFNSLNVLKLLVQNGVTIDEPNPHGSTPLSYASQKDKSLDTVKYLVENGAFINSRGQDLNTPLIWASDGNAIHNVKYLIEHCADIKLTNIRNDTALTIARKRNFTELVGILSNTTFIDSLQTNCTKTDGRVTQPASRFHFDHSLIEFSSYLKTFNLASHFVR